MKLQILADSCRDHSATWSFTSPQTCGIFSRKSPRIGKRMEDFRISVKWWWCPHPRFCIFQFHLQGLAHWKGDPWKSCQCRLVTNPLKTGRSWGSKPTPWPHLLSATYSYIMVDVYYPGVFTKHTIHIGFLQQCGTGKAQWKYICVFDVHPVTQAQTVYKLLHHLRLKHRT